MSRLLCVIGIMPFFIINAFAQFGTTIRTGRPGKAIGAYTLGAKVFQVQSGINFNSIQLASANERNTLTHATVLRLGLVEKIEISGVVNWRQDESIINEVEKQMIGVSNTQIGLRYNIIGTDATLPALGIQGRVLLKAQSEDYRREKLGATVIVMSGKKINDWLSALLNLGVTWSGNNTSARYFYAFTTSYQLSESWGAFTEIYGNLRILNPNFDAGFYYLINNDLQLDVSAGRQRQNARSWFVDGGVSWRIVWRDQ